MHAVDASGAVPVGAGHGIVVDEDGLAGAEFVQRRLACRGEADGFRLVRV